MLVSLLEPLSVVPGKGPGADAEPEMLAPLTFPWLLWLLVTPKLVAVRRLMLLTAQPGGAVSSLRAPLWLIPLDRCAHLEMGQPLLWALAAGRSGGSRKERAKRTIPSIGRAATLPRGTAPVTLGAVFPASRCCVLHDPLLGSTHMAARAAAGASLRASTMGAATEHEVGCARHWGTEAAVLGTPCGGAPKGTGPVLLCEPFVTRYNAAPV